MSDVPDFLQELMDGKYTDCQRGEAMEASVHLGFRLAKDRAASKARQLGYESLAEDIESMTISRRKTWGP